MTQTHAPVTASDNTTAPPAEDKDRLLRELLLEKYEPIAIVGVGLNLPGGNRSRSGFAEFLRAGRTGISSIPEDRWDLDHFAASEPNERGKVHTVAGGFIEGIDQFDPRFFNISPKEANYLDPQQRLVLETAWQALEDANIDPTPLRHGNGGVYVGVSGVDYTVEVSDLPYDQLGPQVGTGTAHSAIPGRVSYFLGWRGPSLAVDTACSSSLAALHLAAEGLRRGECTIALCGGVNVIHHPRNHIVFSEANMLAPDGRCKTFDSSADGYSRSEGCGMVVLKRLSDARRDNNRILALVRGTAVRQDGESGGLTVPNGTAQEAVMRAALSRSMLRPEDIQYVEAHGTGTALGDPIEMGAISAIFAKSHSHDRPLVVGSVKTNIGHMEAAAGVGGLIKAVLQVAEFDIYPHLNVTQPSEHIPWTDFPVVVPSQPRPWPTGTRRAVVNSFGFAGSIASAVIEQAPASEPTTAAQSDVVDGPHVFTVSGRTTQSLAEQIQNFLTFIDTFIEDAPDTDSVGPLCFTSNVGRSHFPIRAVAVVRNRYDLRTQLEKELGRVSADPVSSRAPSKIAMLFTGQGSQYSGMGAVFYSRFPEFRAHVDECDRLFAPLLGRSIAAFVRGDVEDPEAINRTEFAQPALFTLEYATARLWMSWGVEPTVLVGHSIGELAAAAVSGLFSLPDAVTLVSARGRLMQSVTTAGGMVDVAAAADEVGPLLAGYDDLAVAAVNAPGRCVVSGGTESLATVVAALTLRGISVNALPVSHAFHSPLMREIADDFGQVVAGISFHEPQIALVSNISGQIADPAELSTPEYWVRHIRQAVHFADGMQAIEARGRHIFLEVGPSSTLLTLGKRSVDSGQHQWFASHHQRDADVGLRSVAGLYAAGLPLSWRSFHRGRPQQTIDLPHHVFDHRRYWLPTDGNRHSASAVPDIGSLRHPLLGDEIQPESAGVDRERVFRSRIRPDSPGWLAEHVVMGQIIFPGAGYVEALLALLDEVDGSTARTLRDIRIHEPLLMPPGQTIELCTRIRPVGDAAVDIDISTRTHTPDGVIERVHVTAAVAGSAEEPRDADRLRHIVAELTALAGPTNVDVDPAAIEDRYAEFAELGLHYGPQFQRIQWLERHGDTVRAQLRGRRTGAMEQLPPEILDNAMQAVTALIADGQTYLPVRFGRLRLLSKPKSATLRAVLRLAGGSNDDEMSVDLLLLDGDRPVAVVSDLGLKKVKRATATSARNGSAPETPQTNQSQRGAGDRGRLGDDRFGRRVELVHEPRWTKRSLVRPDGELASERRLLVINGQAPATGDLAREAQRRGIEITLAESGDSIADGLKNRPTDVVWYWQSEPGPLGAQRLQVESERNYRNLLCLLDSLSTAGFGRNQRLWLITRSAQQLPGDRADVDADLAAATLWGFGTSLWNEYPSYRVTLVDLDDAGDPRPLLDECAAGSGEEYQLAFRNSLRHVRRIVTAPAPMGSDHENEALTPGERGSLSDLHLVPADDDPPVDDQIQVDIHAAGVNFKDVLNALGLLKIHAQEHGVDYRPIPLGFEGSGTVLAAGPESTFAIGDPVVISHSGCLRRRITVPSSAAVRKPAAIDFEQAAGYPTAYITAHHALHRLADIKPGDSVLVHAAAGGVGQAAVHLAQQAGAIIFATASPRKHELLRAQGIEHIFNSRSVDFADEILDVTGGRGVDIVLNSLNRDYVDAGMRALGQGGRFVELGKIGIWSAERAHRARPDVSYFNFDLAELAPAEWQQFNSESLHFISDLISRGELPALPTTTYALDEAEEAFSVLSRGANVGKLVLSMTDQPVRREPAVKIRPDRCYLLSGGRGALGAITARKLVGLGARELMFVNRSPVDQASIDEVARAVGGKDVRIRMVQCDVADPADVGALAHELAGSGRPLGGVIHAAGVLADMPVSAMTWDDIDRCLRPKMIGGWLLHELAGSFPDVEFFVGFSSVAALLGPVAQANYAAANAFVDNLMRWRATKDLPGLSINWGPWAEAGMAAALDDRRAADIEGQGIRFLKPAVGTRMLVKALGRPERQLVIGEFDWDKVVGRQSQSNPFYSRVASAAASTFTALDLTALRAQPRGAWAAAVNEIIRATLARMLQFDGPQDVATDARFLDLGVDSLVAVELKNNLETTFMVPLTTSIVFDFPTVDLMAEMLVGQLTAESSTANTDEVEQVTDQATQSASQEVA